MTPVRSFLIFAALCLASAIVQTLDAATILPY